MASWCDTCQMPRFETNNELGRRLSQLLMKMEMNLKEPDHEDLVRSNMAEAHDISRRLLGKTLVCQSGGGICTGSAASPGAIGGAGPVQPTEPLVIDVSSTDSENEEQILGAGIQHRLVVTLPTRVLLSQHPAAPQEYGGELRGVGRGCPDYPDFNSAAVPVVGDNTRRGHAPHPV